MRVGLGVLGREGSSVPKQSLQRQDHIGSGSVAGGQRGRGVWGEGGYSLHIVLSLFPPLRNVTWAHHIAERDVVCFLHLEMGSCKIMSCT